MKYLIISLSFVLIELACFGQTDCEIKAEYSNIFKIEKKTYEKEIYLIKTINKIDESSCFSNLINNNTAYIDYLRNNFSDNSNYNNLMSIKSDKKRQKEYIKALTNDSLFNSVMNKLAKKIIDPDNFVPDTVSLDQLLNIAVKFFYIKKINNDGNYIGKICVGINGLKQTEKKRQPLIEAFCFTSIFNHYRGGIFNMYDEFIRGIKELYEINLGIDTQDRLLRAQGGMYMYMKNSKVLEEVIKYEYKNMKDILPFTLIEE